MVSIQAAKVSNHFLIDKRKPSFLTSISNQAIHNGMKELSQPLNSFIFTSRGDWIRTSDHTPPRAIHLFPIFLYLIVFQYICQRIRNGVLVLFTSDYLYFRYKRQ